MSNIVCLLVEAGPLRGHKYIVKSDMPVLVGRTKDSLIRLDGDAYCSRKHALITWENSRCFIEDIETTNGTLVNGKRIVKKVHLHDGDKIIIGKTEITISIKNIKKL